MINLSNHYNSILLACLNENKKLAFNLTQKLKYYTYSYNQLRQGRSSELLRLSEIEKAEFYDLFFEGDRR